MAIPPAAMSAKKRRVFARGLLTDAKTSIWFFTALLPVYHSLSDFLFAFNLFSAKQGSQGHWTLNEPTRHGVRPGVHAAGIGRSVDQSTRTSAPRQSHPGHRRFGHRMAGTARSQI
ncbi:MAG: hypothetical protein ACK5V7_09690 [bacterium]